MKRIRKVMLVYPPVTRPIDFSAKVVKVTMFLPLGIAYLGAVIEKTGNYDLEILDCLSEGNTDEGVLLKDGEQIRYGLTDEVIAERIKEFSPDVVGVPCLFSAMQMDMANICRIAKNVKPSIKTVVGGAHAGLMAADLLREYNEVDFVIVGEAEVSFLNLIMSLEDGPGFSSLNGLAYRENGSINFIPKTEYIEDLDSIPFPARHLFNMNKYFNNAKSHGFFRNTPFTQMITSRGCPCKCTFCALGAHWGSRQRLRSAKNVLDEIEHLIVEYGIKEIHFEDDNLLADKRRSIELFDGMVERNFDIKWQVPSGIAVYTLNEEILSKMKASGCYSISLAIESGNQEVVSKLMNKPVNLNIVPSLVKSIRENGIDVRGFFIIGYPDETKETIRQTIDFARELELDWAYFSIASPLPNTEMYNTCMKKKYIKEEDFDPVRSFHRSIIHTPEFDPEYLENVREEAIVDVCFHNNPNLLKYNVDKAIEDFKDVLRRYPHFDFANYCLGEAYIKKGKKNKAISAYKNTLTVNPSYQMAIERLKELGVQI